MAGRRELWPENFEQNFVPAYPCPTCDHGNLSLIPDSIRHEETGRSRLASGHNDVTPLDGEHRFICLLKCQVPTCGEVVSVCGDAKIIERRDDADQRQFEWFYYPHGFFPAPALVTIPPDTPEIIKHELQTSFQLFWVDLGSCATRLRITVERILDDFGISRGKKLFDRIAEFQTKDPEHAGTFDALRYVGNVGSHEGTGQRETILEAFELLQDALAELFGRRKSRLAALRAKIIASKGK